MGVKKSNLLLWVATTLEILSRGRGTKQVKNRWARYYYYTCIAEKSKNTHVNVQPYLMQKCGRVSAKPSSKLKQKHLFFSAKHIKVNR